MILTPEGSQAKKNGWFIFFLNRYRIFVRVRLKRYADFRIFETLKDQKILLFQLEITARSVECEGSVWTNVGQRQSLGPTGEYG